MPFDIADFQIPAEAKEADPFDYRTFSPGREGLRKLAWVLRHPEVWPGKHMWDFRHVLDRNGCGTVGCAMGVGCLLWPEHFEEAILRTQEAARSIPTARLFNISEPEAKALFYSGRGYGLRMGAVTPAMVASAIDAALARAEALAKSEAVGTPWRWIMNALLQACPKEPSDAPR